MKAMIDHPNKVHRGVHNFVQFSAISQFIAIYRNFAATAPSLSILRACWCPCCHRFWQERGLFGLWQLCKTCVSLTKYICALAC